MLRHKILIEMLNQQIVRQNKNWLNSQNERAVVSGAKSVLGASN